MAGGIGSRFWPYSKTGLPKQFLDILGIGKSLLQLTYERLLRVFLPQNIYVITNVDYGDISRSQLPQLPPSNLLLEPYRKNTAPCIAYSALRLFYHDNNACVGFFPADHFILGEDKFATTVTAAFKAAEKKDFIITVGIRPTRADTNYGYIQFLEDREEQGLFKVKTFVEKPPQEIANVFYRSGDFLWNAGIFISNLRSLLNAYQHYLPEVIQYFKEIKRFINTAEEPAAISRAYSLCPNVSIDTAIMEKARNVMVIPAAFGWSDLGTWASLYQAFPKDYLGNAVKGKNVMIYDAQNCMVMVPDHKLVVLEGLEDFIVVDTEEVLMICRREQEQRIKEIIMDVRLKKGDRFV